MATALRTTCPSVENNKYTVGLRGLEVGSYELKVTGTDDVGNDLSDSYKFERRAA